MGKIALDSIKNDDLWVFKTDYNNTDFPWLELVTQCIHFNSTECLSYLIEDMDFQTLDDYVNCLNKAVKQQHLDSLGCILKESEAFGIFQYLAVASIGKQQEILQSITLLKHNESDTVSYMFKKSNSFTLLDCLGNISFEQQKLILHNLVSVDYPVDWEELFECDVIAHEDIINIAERANFSLSTLVDYITYLLNSSDKELDQQYYSQLIKATIRNSDVIYQEDINAVFDTLVNRYINDDDFVVMAGKCEPDILDIMLLEQDDLSEDLIKIILSKFVNSIYGGVFTNRIDLTAQLIEFDPSFAQSIISHRDFEFDTNIETGYEYQSWEFSIARSLFNSEKFDAIRVLVDNGAKIGCFTKLYFGEENLLAHGVFEHYCEQSDHERFLGEIKQLLENGVTYPQAILECVNGDIAKFDFSALYKLLAIHNTITSKQASDFIIAHYGMFITSYPNAASFIDADLEFKKDDNAYDSYYNYVWDYSRLAYVGEGELTLRG